LNNQLSSFSVKKLKAMCKLLKIKICFKSNKAELIKLIETKQEEIKQEETIIESQHQTKKMAFKTTMVYRW
tara:strand:- start:205 stop:417 length:213 start_codon:yes stop_codon:yes gene_type:complete